MRKRIIRLTTGAVIASLYVLFTFLSFSFASGAVQLRLSEALCILPYFTPVAIPGLFIGCLLANLVTGSAIWDVIFGSLATLIGAVGSYLLRRHRWLVPLPPILANAIIVPLIIIYTSGAPTWTPSLYFGMVATVGLGEVLSCGVLGMLLMKALRTYQKHIFKDQ